jgi:cytidylate kinase
MLTHTKEPLHWDKLVSKQVGVWQVQRQPSQNLHYGAASGPWSRLVVLFSRQHGAGGDDVAHALGEELQWPVYDREIVDYIAQTAHVRSQIVESFDERKQSEIDNWIKTLLDSGSLAIDQYLKHLLHVLVSIAEHGQAILIGRGSPFVVKSVYGIRVLITAPLHWRAQRLAQKRGISNKEALAVIHKVDGERMAFIQRYFHRDPNDGALYDLVLNTEHLAPEQASRIILTTLEQRAGSQLSPPLVRKA